MQDMGIWNAPPPPKRPHGASAGGQVPDFLAQLDDNTLPPARLDLLARRGARIPRRASLPTQEGKEQPWS